VIDPVKVVQFCSCKATSRAHLLIFWRAGTLPLPDAEAGIFRGTGRAKLTRQNQAAEASRYLLLKCWYGQCACDSREWARKRNANSP
jgi:hypothetical protein